MLTRFVRHSRDDTREIQELHIDCRMILGTNGQANVLCGLLGVYLIAKERRTKVYDLCISNESVTEEINLFTLCSKWGIQDIVHNLVGNVFAMSFYRRKFVTDRQCEVKI